MFIFIFVFVNIYIYIYLCIYIYIYIKYPSNTPPKASQPYFTFLFGAPKLWRLRLSSGSSPGGKDASSQAMWVE